ncbi:MAG: hypothetical protein SFW35_12640 [Chitinophagales bacterium]|nr:hypothetical protein [Chitinophagales bacterium]
MNPIHVHLIVNHVALLGSLFGVLALAYGIWRSSHDLVQFAYFMLIVGAVGAAMSHFSGEEAEHLLRNVDGITEAAVEHHEEAARPIMPSMFLLAMLAIVGLVANNRQWAVAGKIKVAVLVVGMAFFGLTAYIANEGGKIRHPEARDSLQASTNANEELED